VDTDTLRVTNFDPRSVAVYRSAANGQFYAFAADSGGTVQQFELRANTTGGVEGTAVRSFEVGGAVSGLVADESQGVLFVAQQSQGIWRYSAEANGGTARTAVATAGQGGLASPLGGLALYSLSGSGGYLLAASPSGDNVVVYGQRPPHTPLGSFRVITNATGNIDEVSGTRSLEASSRALGTLFPAGAVLVHDALNSPAQNHKALSWSNVAAAFNPPLAVSSVDGGSDGGVMDGGTTDGGTGRDGGTTTGPGGGTIDPDPESGCGCATASVSGTVLFVLLGLALRGRRRQQ
jgi:3-phytase